MVNKKFRSGIVVALLLLLVGCTTTAPIFYSNNSQKDFIILGEVTYEGTSRAGFQELLKVARAEYPTCDYVIDVMVDRKVSWFLWITSESYTMRGIAIEYIK